jgi:hypothetical protein
VPSGTAEHTFSHEVHVWKTTPRLLAVQRHISAEQLIPAHATDDHNAPETLIARQINHIGTHCLRIVVPLPGINSPCDVDLRAPLEFACHANHITVLRLRPWRHKSLFRPIDGAYGNAAMSGLSPIYPDLRLNSHSDNTTIASAGMVYAMR